ncbi:peptidase family C50-domain-containing protein [Cristinia sonorae]|uniref:separase n=1 Tax=Cristinia sonorae TaxID=1940300 RepID=A0A8K0ULJ4_9AGAR|nr:peptidase family C50-domain-containing protein [Cristinia sonorae]
MPPRRPTASKPPVPTTARSTSRIKTPATISPDTLASTLASKLAISDTKKKGKLKDTGDAVDVEERCLTAMRAVNAASKRLSALVASGWRMSESKGKKGEYSVDGVRAIVAEAASGLSVLRELKGKDLDIERAASSVLGKLVTLELFDAATALLSDMHDPLARLYSPSYCPPASLPVDYILTLPHISETNPPPSDIIYGLICSYITNALASYCSTLRDPTPGTGSFSLESFVSAIRDESPGTFTHWLRYLATDTSRAKMIDSTCTKLYTVFTKTCSWLQSPAPSRHPIANPPVIFSLRSFSLTCLAYTSPGTIECDAFWSEVGRVTAEYRDWDINARQHDILKFLDTIISIVERRPDRDLYLNPNGKRLAHVMEGWLIIARAANDALALERISRLLGPSPTLLAQPLDEKVLDAGEALRLCSILTRTESLFSQDPTRSVDVIDASIKALKNVGSYLRSFMLSELAGSDDNARIAVDKVRRSFERVRRLAARALETASADDVLARQVLEVSAEVLESVLTKSKFASSGGETLLLSWLDSLFVLSKSALLVPDPSTYDAAYKWLERANSLLSNSTSFPNHLRILSGAYYSLSGTLYRAGKYSFAIRFLDRGCSIGANALTVWKRECSNLEATTDTRIVDHEAWTALEEGMYKRWEVLGVCHSKSGDRKLAYEAFSEAIRHYPFFNSAFLDIVKRTPASLFFSTFPSPSADTSPSSPFHPVTVAQLGVLIDRVTYMGICELFMNPEDVSLARHFTVQDDATRVVVGILLERQIQSLEPSRYKPAVKTAISTLLDKSLDVYSSNTFPIRRAGIWVKWLEISYFGIDEFGEEKSAKVVGEETQELLSREDFALDAPMKHLRARYQTMLHLWLALHIHRSGVIVDYVQIARHSEDACKVVKAMLQSAPSSGPRGSLIARPKMVTIVSPKQVVAPAKKAMGRSSTKVKTTIMRTRAARTVAPPPVTPKPKKALQSSSNLLTQASPPVSIQASSPFDDFSKLCELLQMVSQLLGLLGHVVTKIHLLNVTRRLCERYIDTKPEDFVQVSLDLGHEYAQLGKVERAANVYASVRHCINTAAVADELRALYYLRYAELLGTIGNVLKGSSTYCEATGLLERLEAEDDKPMTTVERVHLRVMELERVAVAATSFATLQYSKDDPTASLNGLMQALRLYHRAIDTFTRLIPPPPKPAASDNPFDMTSVADALNTVKDVTPGPQQLPAPDNPPRKTYTRKSTMSALEWRVATGLLSTLFALAQTYLARGSAREAEYFVTQAKDLAESLNASAMTCRALTRMGELKLGLGKIDEAHDCLVQAANLIEDGVAGVDAADLRRLKGELSSKVHADGENRARASYEEAMTMLEELDDLLAAHDTSIVGLRNSAVVSPRSSLSPQHDSLMPALFVAVLRRNITLLHGAGEEYRTLLDRLQSLPSNPETKAEESSLLAKLTLEEAYARFRADMLLGSLAESTITLPIGMTGERMAGTVISQDILGTLSAAEKLFWSDLALVARRGKVSHVRDAVVSLALIKAFQTSLGQSQNEGATLTARLLDSSAAITPRREMLEVIQHKFSDALAQDDLRWPLITPSGSIMQQAPRSRKPAIQKRRRDSSPLGSPLFSDDDTDAPEPASTNAYWNFVASRYKAQLYDPSDLQTTQTSLLPAHWSVISITLTSDQKSLFVTRQCRGTEPLIFCIPLKGRRDAEDEEQAEGEEPRPVSEGGQMGYSEVIQELNEVIRLSDEGTRGAVNVDKTDKHARAKWWKERSELDKRMKTLLENIEFCWLGAFKTILSEPVPMPPSVLAAFRSRLESIFVRTLLPPAPAPPQSRKHKAKGSSAGKNAARLDLTISDALLETFANLSPTAPSEELEDLAYFILDLYAFHGGPNMGVVVAEVDMDELVLDIRSALEEVSAGRQKHAEKLKKSGNLVDHDQHTFLVLDKNVQGIPWECIPILQGKSVSRIPSMEFLVDRILWAKHQRGEPLSSDDGPTADASQQDESPPIDRVSVNPTNTFVILNPSGDLKNTEGRFADWLSQMQNGAGWDSIVGRAPSEAEMAHALATKDLVIYFGHGGAEQYIRSHKIRHLNRCAATMLWGCSSGLMRDMGEFDRVGTPLNYVVAGCPTLVANLWDVTDRDIDKFSQAVFDKINLSDVEDVKSWQSRCLTPQGKLETNGATPMSVVRAIAESREVCKLKYLTGAAPIVYGIPFYL